MPALSLLNSVLGPVMRGPSSSHAAAPYAIAKTARELSTSAGGEITRAGIRFDPGGSFARVYRGQGSDEGFAAGLCGIDVDSDRYLRALPGLVRDRQPFEFSIEIAPLEDCDHPNRVDLDLACRTEEGRERRDTYRAVSTGGGTFVILSLNSLPVEITGDTGTLIIEGGGHDGPHIERILNEFGDVLVSSLRILPNAILARTRRGLTGEEQKPLGDVTAAVLIREAAPRQFPVTAEPPLFQSAADVLSMSKGLPVHRIAEAHEAHQLGISDIDVRDLFRDRLAALLRSVENGLGLHASSSQMMYLRPSAAHLRGAPAVGNLVGAPIQAAMSAALSVLELNTSRGIICAAPTAGSAGIVPGCLYSLREQGVEEDRLANALEVMAVIGAVILSRATFAAEIGGCAAETGSAAAMAAGGLAYTYGATSAQVFDAASLCLMNTLGLVCDPVSGHVEIPCHARNLAGIGHAYTAAASVLGGFRAGLPFDEVADALLAVGRRMCADFLCTARGGLAATPTAIGMGE